MERILCHFDPARDISAVSQSDYIDVRDAFVNGLVPENVASSPLEYDGVEDPLKVFGRPANEFEAIHMAQSVKQASESVGKTE